MTHIVYFLADPREPLTVRYVGRSSQHPTKRLSDHISQAKWRHRENEEFGQCYRLPPVMQWIVSLPVEPILWVFMICDSKEQSIEVESQLADAWQGLTLNHPRANHAAGRPEGQRDRPETLLRKSESFTTRSGTRIAGWQENRRRRRVALGYPHPEFGVRHPLNSAYNHTLTLAKRAAERI